MPEENRIRVLVTDDHPTVRRGIAALLAREPGIEIVGEAMNGAEAVAQFQALVPDVVLMDLQMPVLDGVAATNRIRNLAPDARVIAISTYASEFGRAREAGVVACVLKDAMVDELVAAIRAVAPDGRGSC